MKADTTLTVHFVHGSNSFNVERLAFLLTELDKVHHQAVPERFSLFSLEKRKEDILKTAEKGYLFYAEFHSQTVGFASVLKRKEALMIEHLYVEPEYRHKKIGTKIIESILEKFPNQEIFASVYAFNSEAIRFYESLFELSSLVFKRKKHSV